MESFVWHNIKFKIPALLLVSLQTLSDVLWTTHTPSGQCSFTETARWWLYLRAPSSIVSPCWTLPPKPFHFPAPNPLFFMPSSTLPGRTTSTRVSSLGLIMSAAWQEEMRYNFTNTMSTPTRPNFRNTAPWATTSPVQRLLCYCACTWPGKNRENGY